MRALPIIICIIISIGSISLFFLVYSGMWGVVTEDNLTLMRCSGDRFAFIQGTYLDPVTEVEIATEQEAVLSRVNVTGGQVRRAGGIGGGGSVAGGGPGESRIVAWGYCIDFNGSSSGFGYGVGYDFPSKNAIDESNRWYQEKIVNRSLDCNATCIKKTVVERFRNTGIELKRIT